MADRRQNERYRTNGRVFAYYETHSPKIAEIADIGTHGVAFSYVGSAETINQPLDIEIILPDSTRCMNKLPCRTVSDCQIVDGLDGHLGTRRCSVAFTDLTDDQRAMIENFIEKHCWRVRK